jgi:hypothetical protein
LNAVAERGNTIIGLGNFWIIRSPTLCNCRESFLHGSAYFASMVF